MPKPTLQGGVLNCSILVDGKTISVVHPLISINLQFESYKIPTATLVFDDLNENPFDPGKEVVVKVGYNDELNEIFKGIVVKNRFKVSSGNQLIIIECKSKAYLLTLGNKNAVFKKQKISDILKSIVSKNGLSCTVDPTKALLQQLVQYNVSDWDFIVSQAEINGLVVNVLKDGKIEIKEPKITTAKLSYTLGVDIYEFDSEYDARTLINKESITATNWDSKTQKIVTGKSNLNITDFTDYNSKKAASNIKQKEYNLIHPGNLSPDELVAWANGKYMKSAFSQILGTLSAIGTHELQLGETLEILGFNTTTNGKVYVSGIRHSVQNGNWMTTYQFGLSNEWHSEKYTINPAINSGLLNQEHGLHIGTVAGIINDPENNFQIELKIASLGIETPIYARMTFPDAGKNRGICFFPEVNDEVVVGFTNNDFRFPIILGYLYSGKNTPPIKPEAPNFIKGIYTKTGIEVIFDDNLKKVTIKTPGGNSVVLDDTDSSIKIEDKNSNKIDMEIAGISITSPKDIKIEAMGKIDIKATGDLNLSGMNVNIKAMAQLKEEGTAGVEIKSAAITVVKGSLVKIN